MHGHEKYRRGHPSLRTPERLPEAKREGESFSEVIDRLLTEMGAAHTGRDILRGVEAFPPLS